MSSANHKMTRNKYYEMKKQLKAPVDDARVMKKFGYGASTVRKIRNSKDWHDYEARTHRFGGYPRKGVQSCNSVHFTQFDDSAEFNAENYWEQLNELLERSIGVNMKNKSVERTKRYNKMMQVTCIVVGLLIGLGLGLAIWSLTK